MHSANDPASELFDEVSQVQTSAELLQVLNVSADFDVNWSHLEIPHETIAVYVWWAADNYTHCKYKPRCITNRIWKTNNAEDCCQNLLQKLHKNTEYANDAGVVRHIKAA